MIKLRKIFTYDVVPQLGTATIPEGEYDPVTGLVYFGDDGVVHISAVRSASVVRERTQPVTPAPIVRKVPPRKP